MNEFNLDAFSSSLDEAIKYIKVNKSVNINERYRIETNKNDEIVKVYVIENGKIKTVAHFNNGKLIYEFQGGTKKGLKNKHQFS